MMFWSIGFAAAAAGICWGGYFFALLSLLDQRNGFLLKNARLLCMLSPLKSFAVLALLLAMGFVLAILTPVSIVLLLTCAVVLVQYTLCFFVYGLAERYILTKAE